MSKNKDEIVQEEAVDEAVNDYEPEPGPTPEQQEEEERERQAIEAAKLKPYRDLKNTINEHDDLMAEALYEITMLQIGMEG
jgi:hypothetical protein